MIPQIIAILIMVMSLAVSADQHGRRRRGKHNFYVALACVVIVMFILSAGGFFDPLFKPE